MQGHDAPGDRLDSVAARGCSVGLEVGRSDHTWRADDEGTDCAHHRRGRDVVTGLCCVTPALVIGLGALGLTAWVGWLDPILFPVLIMFLGLTAYGWSRLRRRSEPDACCGAGTERPVQRS